MRIALVSEWLDAWRGGAETSTLQFLHHLLDAGLEVDVYTRSRLSPAPGLGVVTISGAAATRTRRSSTFAQRVDRRVRDVGYDVVHAISPCRSATVYQPRGGTVAESIERNLALLRRPSMRSLKRLANRLNLKQRYLLSMERRLFDPRRGPTVVAISQYVARQLREHYALPESRIRVIYNAVDPDVASPSQRIEDRRTIRQEYGVGDGELLVILVAHNYRLKGVACWLEALSLLVREGATPIRSLVIGKNHSARWDNAARRLGVQDRVRFVGPSSRVAAFMHAADALVHPTYYDPCSRVVLEGMVSGLACVTTRWDGASEVIRDGVSGLILDEPGDAGALAARVRTLNDPDVRRNLAAHAAQVAPAVSMARHAREMIELYQALVPHVSDRRSEHRAQAR